MQQITIGTKNQIVIPKEVRKKIKDMRPGQRVLVYPLDENTVAIKVEQSNWVDRGYGLMKDAWKGIDPIKEVEKMRNEW